MALYINCRCGECRVFNVMLSGNSLSVITLSDVAPSWLLRQTIDEETTSHSLSVEVLSTHHQRGES